MTQKSCGREEIGNFLVKLVTEGKLVRYGQNDVEIDIKKLQKSHIFLI